MRCAIWHVCARHLLISQHAAHEHYIIEWRVSRVACERAERGPAAYSNEAARASRGIPSSLGTRRWCVGSSVGASSQWTPPGHIATDMLPRQMTQPPESSVYTAIVGPSCQLESWAEWRRCPQNLAPPGVSTEADGQGGVQPSPGGHRRPGSGGSTRLPASSLLSPTRHATVSPVGLH